MQWSQRRAQPSKDNQKEVEELAEYAGGINIDLSELNTGYVKYIYEENYNSSEIPWYITN